MRPDDLKTFPKAPAGPPASPSRRTHEEIIAILCLQREHALTNGDTRTAARLSRRLLLRLSGLEDVADN